MTFEVKTCEKEMLLFYCYVKTIMKNSKQQISLPEQNVKPTKGVKLAYLVHN
jgi:hypothetical protein